MNSKRLLPDPADADVGRQAFVIWRGEHYWHGQWTGERTEVLTTIGAGVDASEAVAAARRLYHSGLVAVVGQPAKWWPVVAH